MKVRSHDAVLRGVFALVAVLSIAGCSGGSGVKENPPPGGNPDPDPPQAANPSGLDARPVNTTCVAPERASGSTTIGTERVFPNLRFNNQPIYLLQAPGDSSRWYVPERLGTVRVFDNKPDVATASLFLDIDARVDSTCAECGLLGLAFHPNYPSDPRVYISYTTMDRPLRGPNSQLSEFTTRDGGLTLDPDSERKLFTIPKESVHHHAGRINFGPDGYLYMSVGDGNSFRNDNGQKLTTLLGKILRIDVNGTTGSALYRIPPDNPFASSTTLCNVDGSGPQNCPEIYAWGFRNPWSWSFDRETGDLWVGDVGESAIEEVNRVRRGGNYGWRCFEGTVDVSSRWATGATCAAKKDLLPPIAQYSHTLGSAVMGGYVYRGKAIPSLRGRYLFADFSAGRIWDIPNDTQPTLEITGGGQTLRRP